MIYNFDDLFFKILMVDRFIHKEGFFDVKARPFSVLSFRVRGSGAFEIGNKRFLTQKGDVMFFACKYAVQSGLFE